MKYNSPLALAASLAFAAGAHAGVIASNTTSDAANVTEVNQWGFDTTNHGVQGHASGVYPEWGAYCLAQSFTTGALGGVNQLSSISVGTVGAVTASTVTAYLYETTTGASPDNNYWKVAATPAATATATLSAAAGPTTVTFDFSSADLTLKDNTTYVFYLRPTTGSAFTWAGSSTNSYAGGEAMGVFADANLGGGPGFWTGNLNSVASTDITGDRVFSVATSGTFEIPLDPQDGGRVFEGIGALSAGASSRLLIDYPEPQRSEVLDFLFKPNFGASLPHLKVEIGGEINSTCGSEPSHQRTREDLNFQRGYEWWLMKEAKTRRPDILLDALPWGAPGWIGNGSYYSQDMADYIARFIQGAKSEHGLDIHYTGIWNERPYNAAWIKLLRRTLNDNGLNQVEIVAADEFNMNWRIADDAANDSELNQAIAVFGEHYPLQYTMPSAVAKASGKRLWASEEGPWRGDWQGAKAIASQLNRNYVQGRITKSITWSLVSSYYDSLRLPDSGMMRAKEPWSGHYEVQPAVWVIAHHNQFAKPGWRYLDQACRMLPSGGSVVAMASPSGTDASVVIETIGAAGAQTFTLDVDASLTSREWQLWKTDQTESFIHVGVQSLIDGKLTLELAPDSVYSLTTTTGQAKGVKQAPASQKFPMPYSDDFESYAIGRTPRYFSDQAGTFEVIHRADGQGKALEQVLRAPGIEWENRPEQFHPFTVIGAPDAKDYLVSVDVEAADGVTVALIGRYGRIQHSESSAFAKGYRLEVTAGSGAWKLSKPDAILAQGTSPFPANTWHNFQLEARGTTLICRINGTVVAQAQDSTHFEGLAGLAAGYAGARFDNFVLSNFDGAYHWGGGNGTWTDTSGIGWNGGPPASGDSATINTGTVTATGNNQQAGVALTIGSAGVLSDGGNYMYFGPSGSLTLNGGTIHITRPDIGFGWYAASLSPVVNANSGSSSITGSAGIRLEGDTTFTGDGNLAISHGLHNYTDGYGYFATTSITKTGSGTLTLSGASGYTGTTTVNAGTLVADTAGTLGSGNLIVADGATCDIRNISISGALADSASIHLNGTGKLIIASGVTESVSQLYVNGVRQNVGTYNSTSLPSHITGSGSLNVLGTAAALTTPVSRQIFQRNGANTGSIVISGSYTENPDSIEARAVVMAGAGNNGTTTPWTTIVSAPSGGTFSGTLSGVAAGGWYQIEVRLVMGGVPASNIITVERVGVGDLYITAGQSNSCNWGEPGINTDDRVSAMNFSNGAWSMAADPMPGGDGPQGSVWTRLGTLLTANDNVPVGFVCVGVGSTAVSYWVPPATNGYLRLKAAAQAFPPNGFRAVLWHQGESDSLISTTPADYQSRLSSAIAQLRTDAGWTIPWYVAEASDLSTTALTQEEPVIAGQRRLIYADAQVFAGPSTDDFHLEGKLYDGVHFNNAGMADHAQQWAGILAGTASLAPKNGNIEANTALGDGGIAVVNMSDTSSNSVISWRILNASGEAVADGSNGYFNPDAFFYGATATDTNVSGGVLPNMSGRHVAFFYGGSGGNQFLQTRRATLQASTTYALTVALGVRGNNNIHGNARIELLANGVSLASRDVTQAELDTLNGGNAANTFTDVQLTYASGSSVTPGQPLSIRITKLNGEISGNPTYVDFDNVRLEIVASDYNSWASANHVTGGATGDDDDDGLSNFEEYAFGLDPRNSSSVRTVTTLALKTTGSLTYTRRKTSLSGLSYKVWTSTDLNEWTEDTGASQNVTAIPGTDKESVEVTLSPERLGADRLFVRIMAA